MARAQGCLAAVVRLALAAAVAVALGGAGAAGADERSVAEEILDVLHANGQITDAQYRQLMERAKAERKGEGQDFRVHWHHGLRLTSRDKAFKLAIGGRIQTDWAAFGEDGAIRSAVGAFGNGTELRRARLYVAGTIHERVGFKAQYDFAGGLAHFKDLYLELKKLPLAGNLKIGHFKEPYGLEEQTSSKYLTFMERSVANVAPSRNVGLMLHDHALGRRLTWAFGGFWESDGFGRSDTTQGADKQFNLTGRVTVLPWYADEGAKLLHLGLSYSHKFRTGNALRLRQKPEAHLGHELIDTGSIPIDGADLVTPELALVWGPFSLQGEATWVSLDAVRQPDPAFWGYYVEASYFLTGEHRAYKRGSGSFGRVGPLHDFGEDGGLGAWQVAVRYSHADYDDEQVQGGRLSDLALGVNWHLNPNVRFSVNYVHSRLESVGDVDLGEGRFQIDF